MFIFVGDNISSTIHDYTGIWIPQKDDSHPLTVIDCKKLSNTTIECIFKDSWHELTYIFVYHNNTIVHAEENSHIGMIGKYDVHGEINWYRRYSGGIFKEIGSKTVMTNIKWRRPQVSNYVGIWELQSNDSKELMEIRCKQLSEEQLECKSQNDKNEKRLIYRVRKTSVTNNANSTLQGRFKHDGSISWYMEEKHFMTWKRKGKLFAVFRLEIMYHDSILFSLYAK